MVPKDILKYWSKRPNCLEKNMAKELLMSRNIIVMLINCEGQYAEDSEKAYVRELMRESKRSNP